MKPISEMNDREKSAYLITLCDFSQDFMLEHAGLWQAGRAINLYEPLNMALAWLVLNWAADNMPGKHGHKPALYDSIQGID